MEDKIIDDKIDQEDNLIPLDQVMHDAILDRRENTLFAFTRKLILMRKIKTTHQMRLSRHSK